jgi:hypothetical protein
MKSGESGVFSFLGAAVFVCAEGDDLDRIEQIEPPKTFIFIS